MDLRRRPDWADRLQWAVIARRQEPFRYGEHDCCLAAAALVEAMTGVDPVPGRLRAYKSADGARRRLQRHGGVAGLADHVLGQHGAKQVAPAFAQRGDVVACSVTGDAGMGATALGVVSLDGRWAFVPADAGGWAEAPAATWTDAWRIEWP